MEYILLLLLLQVKHWYADFVLQTYEQTIKKGSYGNWVGITHSRDHFIYTLAALLIFSSISNLIPASVIVLIALVESIVHYHIDWFKVKFGTKNMQSSMFWNQFGLDQLAHQLTYLAIVFHLLK